MARSRYAPEGFGSEVTAPSGYYQPLEEGFAEFRGRRLLYTLGCACIEASCCGIGSWEYLRVEGYVVENSVPENERGAKEIEIDTIETAEERAVISKLLLDKHPGVRIEFR